MNNVIYKVIYEEWRGMVALNGNGRAPQSKRQGDAAAVNMMERYLLFPTTLRGACRRICRNLEIVCSPLRKLVSDQSVEIQKILCGFHLILGQLMPKAGFSGFRSHP